MATVPFQTSPQQELATGSEVQFGATSVDPQRDVVSDDITRQSQAMSNLGGVLNKLDNELNDAESKKLANNYYADAEAIKDQYSNLKGVNAVGSVTVDGKQVKVFDQYQNEMKKLLESYQTKASNGVVKYIFENKAQVYTKSFLNDMTTHSLKQSRLQLEKETDAELDININNAKINYKDFRDPSGQFVRSFLTAHKNLEEKAKLKGWNLDPNAVNINGEKIGISRQYLKERSELNMEIGKAVVDSFNKNKDANGVKEFLKEYKNYIDNAIFNKISKGVEQKHENFNAEKISDAVLVNNQNQNNGNYLTQINKLMTLKTNQAFEDGKGAVVTDGLDSDKFNTIEKNLSENIETLQQERDISKFYSSESTLQGTLIQEHQPTHLYAIQRLGVKKADSLYTKAKSELDINTTKYKEDAAYAQNINEKIIDNYNKLIIEESNKIYGRFGVGNYAIAIANDLEVIKKGIDYNYKNTNAEVKVDFITSLRPLENLKQEIKETITDKETQKHGLKDLEAKYNKIKNERENIYNQALNTAKEISFAEPNGYKNLATNNIDIENFSKSDQELLKKGQPQESDVDTVVTLINNPAETRNNLSSYSHLVSQSDYLGLKNYADSLQNENKYLEATGNVTMLQATLDRYDMGDLYRSKNKTKNKKYIAIHDAWLTEINAQQVEKGNVKLTRAEKQKALDTVLFDNVNVDNDPFLGFIGGSDTKDKNIFFVDQDRLQDVYVDIPYKGENVRVFTSKIEPNFVLPAIQDALRKADKPVTQKNIADYWVRKGQPKTLNEAFAYKEEE